MSIDNIQMYRQHTRVKTTYESIDNIQGYRQHKVVQTAYNIQEFRQNK